MPAEEHLSRLTTGSVSRESHWVVTVRKTCLGYRFTFPLEHTLLLSACELLALYGWCTTHITELEEEANRQEQAEAEILVGRYTGEEPEEASSSECLDTLLCEGETGCCETHEE